MGIVYGRSALDESQIREARISTVFTAALYRVFTNSKKILRFSEMS